MEKTDLQMSSPFPTLNAVTEIRSVQFNSTLIQWAKQFLWNAVKFMICITCHQLTRCLAANTQLEQDVGKQIHIDEAD